MRQYTDRHNACYILKMHTCCHNDTCMNDTCIYTKDNRVMQLYIFTFLVYFKLLNLKKKTPNWHRRARIF